MSPPTVRERLNSLAMLGGVVGAFAILMGAVWFLIVKADQPLSDRIASDPMFSMADGAALILGFSICVAALAAAHRPKLALHILRVTSVLSILYGVFAYAIFAREALGGGQGVLPGLFAIVFATFVLVLWIIGVRWSGRQLKELLKESSERLS